MRLVDSAKHAAQQAMNVGGRALAYVPGMRQSWVRLTDDASAYWNDTSGNLWKAYSHWEEAPEMPDGAFHRIGAEHLAMFRDATAHLGLGDNLGRVVDWGCGGGANAITFGRHADTIIGVDVAEESVKETARQVAEHTTAEFVPVTIKMGDPDAAVSAAGYGTCDVVVCYYVFELLPHQEMGEKVVEAIHRLLRPGGVAHIQIKYDDGKFTSKSRRRDYRRGLADMTTWRIDEFWKLCVERRFAPHSVRLVPHNHLDHRYAYFTLVRN